MRFLNVFSKCQSKDVYQQLAYGARIFDIRVSFDDDNLIFKHGLVTYDYSQNDFDEFMDILDFLDGKYVRLILEDTKYVQGNKILFYDLCEELKNKYPDVTFFGGYRKYDWELLYDFENNIEVEQWCSSMRSLGVFPRLYSFFMNKKHLTKDIPNSESKYHIIDFLNKKL